jgi:cobalt-zinc-cadmium efflux system protein
MSANHHSHDHGSHDHNHAHGANERRVFWAMILTAVFMVAEVVGGVISGSLALLADAAHMLTDAAALGLAWGAFRIARRPADKRRSYGYDRFQVIAAFVNGLSLILLVGWIFWEAFDRILTPSPILAGPMLIVAILGLVVNIVAFFILHGGAKDNINIEGALLHVLGDMLGSVAAIIAAVVIMQTGWTPIDPILSIFVGLLILKSGWRLVKKAIHILMEGTPDAFDIEAMQTDMIDNISSISDVHHVHVWLLTSEKPLITMHATIIEGADPNQALIDIKARLSKNYDLEHSTVQIEAGECVDH